MPATLAALRRGSASSQPSGQPQPQPALQPVPQQAPQQAAPAHRSPSQRRGASSAESAPESEADDEFASGDDGDDGDDADAALDEEGTAGEQLRNETTVKSGYLYKRGEKRKNWKKRWFVLRSSKLCYYKNEKEYQLLRFIDMGDVHTVAPIELKRVENAFGIVTSSRQYYVRASSRADKESWLAALLDVKEQVRQRSTITSSHERDDGDLPTPSGEGANTPTPQTISVTIPGGGRYDAPARPRAIPGSLASPGGSGQQAGASRDGLAFSPLTATSLSASASEGEHGAQAPPRVAASAAAAGASAEQFGLSYASQSSAGQSFGSSPPALRHGGAGTAAAQSAARSPSPHLSSGEVSQSEGAARRRSMRQGSSSERGAQPDASVGSSGGEGRTTGWTRKPDGAAGSEASATAAAAAAAAAAAGALSSSDEEEEDWDEDEVADLAMPLPGQTAAAPASQAQSAQGTPSASRTTPAPQTPQRATDPNKVIHQGYLMKQSSRRKTWRKRWFVLTGSTLMYTRSHMDAKANRAIPLSSILDALEYTSKKTGQNPGGLSVSAAGAQSPQLQSPSHAGAPFSFSLPSAPDSANASSTAAGSDGAAATNSTAAGATGATAEAASAPGAERGAAPPLLSPGASTTSSGAAPAAPSSSAVSGVTSGLSNIGLGMGGVSVPGVGRGESQKRKKEHCFKILTPKRTFVVCAPTEEEEIKWLSAIQALLTRTRGQTQPPATPTPQAAAPAPAPSATLGSPTVASPAGAKTALPARPVRSASANSGATTTSAAAAPAQQGTPSAAAQTLDEERSPNRPRVPSNASHRSISASQA